MLEDHVCSLGKDHIRSLLQVVKISASRYRYGLDVLDFDIENIEVE
jgi:hypothetical protein